MKKNEKKEAKTIRTLHFGELIIQPEHIFCFDGGLLGFEDLREFVLISDDDTVPFKWLISLEKPEIGFPMLSPWHIDLTYDPGDEINLEHQVLFIIVTLEDEKGVMTANMKAPVVLDVKDQSGRQIILPSDKYSVNWPIIKE